MTGRVLEGRRGIQVCGKAGKIRRNSHRISTESDERKSDRERKTETDRNRVRQTQDSDTERDLGRMRMLRVRKTERSCGTKNKRELLTFNFFKNF